MTAPKRPDADITPVQCPRPNPSPARGTPAVRGSVARPMTHLSAEANRQFPPMDAIDPEDESERTFANIPRLATDSLRPSPRISEGEVAALKAVDYNALAAKELSKEARQVAHRAAEEAHEGKLEAREAKLAVLAVDSKNAAEHLTIMGAIAVVGKKLDDVVVKLPDARKTDWVRTVVIALIGFLGTATTTAGAIYLSQRAAAAQQPPQAPSPEVGTK
jgi:hypothetical protein